MLETLTSEPLSDQVETLRGTSGYAIAIWGTPGSGKTAIALNVAMELALIGNRVLLADLDTKGPSLSAYLGNPSEKSTITSALRMAHQGRLNPEQFMEITEPLECDGVALRFLAGLRSPNRWTELSAAKLGGLLDVAKQTFDFAIFDLSSDVETGLVRADSTSFRTIASEYLTMNCDKTVVIFQADPIGVNRLLWALQDFSGDPLVVANGFRNSVMGKNYKSQISEVLERFGQTKVDLWIPWDQSAFDAGLMRGQPLWLASRSSKARAVLAELAQRLVDSDY